MLWHYLNLLLLLFRPQGLAELALKMGPDNPSDWPSKHSLNGVIISD